VSDNWLALGTGQLIAGHYTLERLLGNWCAWSGLSRQPPVPRSRCPQGVHWDRHEAALIQEAHLLSQVNHPSIIRIFDAGITKTEQHTFAFLTMEYLPLGSLASHLQSVGCLRVSQALAVAEQLLVAIAHLGALIHRSSIGTSSRTTFCWRPWIR
jgi:hypothetical protein